MSYDIYLECENGTSRMVDDTGSTRWERPTSVIWWTRDYSLEAAKATVRALSDGNPVVKRVWYEEGAT